MSVKIVNMRWSKHPMFRCDRTSPLGNPFRMRDKSQAERNRVCDKYYNYFHENLNPDKAPPGFLEQLDEILQAAEKGDVTIGCWCVPDRCHCQTIKNYVDQQIRLRNA